MRTVPGFYKGQIVTPRMAREFGPKPYGVRKATAAEIEAWYKDHPGMNDAGESYVHDGTTGVVMNPGTKYTVVRGRCTAYSGWMTRSGYCELEAEDGSRFKADRRDLVVVS